MNTLYDERAVKILFDTYWSSKGWKTQNVTPPADLTYAIGKGVMFPPRLLPHDDTLAYLRALCETIPPASVGNAFLASLSSRELTMRSPLGSFAVARFRPPHQFTADPVLDACSQCCLHFNPTPSEAADLNVLNFERMKWGGVRHTDAVFHVLDLEEFKKLPPATPTEADVTILHRILATIRTLPPGANVAKLEKAIAGIFPSSKEERRNVIEILSLCGVFSYSGYHDIFDDSEPPKGRTYRDSEWGFPAMYWRAEDGYNTEWLREYFPAYAARLATA
jgi:hypothetical protein